MELTNRIVDSPSRSWSSRVLFFESSSWIMLSFSAILISINESCSWRFSFSSRNSASSLLDDLLDRANCRLIIIRLTSNKEDHLITWSNQKIIHVKSWRMISFLKTNLSLDLMSRPIRSRHLRLTSFWVDDLSGLIPTSGWSWAQKESAPSRKDSSSAEEPARPTIPTRKLSEFVSSASLLFSFFSEEENWMNGKQEK